jgi:hypothetical protein
MKANKSRFTANRTFFSQKTQFSTYKCPLCQKEKKIKKFRTENAPCAICPTLYSKDAISVESQVVTYAAEVSETIPRNQDSKAKISSLEEFVDCVIGSL